MFVDLSSPKNQRQHEINSINQCQSEYNMLGTKLGTNAPLVRETKLIKVGGLGKNGGNLGGIFIALGTQHVSSHEPKNSVWDMYD